MLKSRYFIPSFSVLALVGILHWIASAHGYYWTVDWYDIMMHFLGGAWVALVALWIADSFPRFSIMRYASLRNILLFVFAFGVAWEIFELIMCFSDPSMPDYKLDTVIDLIMDTLGGLVATKLFKQSSI